MSLSSWGRIRLLAFGLAVSAGCGWPWPCPGGGTDAVSVVLTFDDGPLPADVPMEVRADGGEELLDPLKIILEILQRRGVQAVFFVAGPGPSGETDALLATWAEGLAAMHAAGHVLGYHAFDHNAEVWAAPLRPPAIALSMMSADLDELERVVDQALGPLALARTEVFSPLFRQPFGGALFSSHEGWRTAHERGWTYHAYAIDSADWIVNADVGLALRDQVVSRAGGGASQVVIDQLTAGTAGSDCLTMVDVLLHVNHLTADHLDEWMDTLTVGFAERGRAAVFEVPTVYLNNDTLGVDLSVWSMVLCGD